MNDGRSGRILGALIATAWLLAAICLLYRSGRYPAAMTGDEIWFSESAWRLLSEGSLKRPLHAGALSSEIADYLPPLIALVQALSFATFGLNAFAVGLQSALAPLAIGGLITLLARRSGARLHWAALAGFAAMGVPSILRASLYIRYEALVLICLLGALTARPPILRGALIALAGVAYYPTAPFVGIAALLVERRRAGPHPWGRLGIGFMIPVMVFALWVAGHPAAFVQQVLQNGAGNYFTLDLPRRLFDPSFWRGSLDVIPEVVVLIALTGFALAGRIRSAPPGLLLAIAALAAPALLYPFSGRLLALPSALLLASAAGWASAYPRLIGGALIGVSASAAIALPMMAATAWVQEEGRDTNRLSKALGRAMIEPGLAVIDQRAWLAVKMSQPERPLLQVMPSGAPPQALVFQPKILLNSDGVSEIKYLILNAADALATIAKTPALSAGFGLNGCVEVERFSPRFTILPWAKTAPYDLILYDCKPKNQPTLR